MDNNKKIYLMVAGAVAAVAGVGVYKYVASKQNTLPAEIWTTVDMPDLTGKVIIVTGANSGIGYEAAKEFAREGGQTILACRSMEKAQAAMDQIKTEIPDAKLEIMYLDLANLESIRKFADQFKAQYERLDVLLNNAGIMMVPYGTTEDGFERQFGTNHLGHFALTGSLIDLLTNTPNARVVNVSSNGHRFGTMDFDNLMFADGQDYSPMDAYGRSKLANLLFTYELQRRFEAAGVSAIATAAHPGISDTSLADHMFDRWHLGFLKPAMGWFTQSAAMGALPSLRAAVDPNVSGGEYFGPGGPNERDGYPVIVQSNQASQNLEDAQQLWEVSEDLTGVRYLTGEIALE
jgi:NAD(P)-dependent dehydrogenase (short-subunit alcohol dehydrogenase family)